MTVNNCYMLGIFLTRNMWVINKDQGLYPFEKKQQHVIPLKRVIDNFDL